MSSSFNTFVIIILRDQLKIYPENTFRNKLIIYFLLDIN